MVVFLANRGNLQATRLHDRITQRLQATFDDVRRRRTDPRDPGPYRVVGDANPRELLADPDYPTPSARIEIGFRIQTEAPHEYYWFHWIEPERDLLVGWHQDGTHDDVGPVHLQVNHGETAVDRKRAHFIDSHPLDVVERRLATLPDAVRAVEWADRRPRGLDPSAPVVA